MFAHVIIFASARILTELITLDQIDVLPDEGFAVTSLTPCDVTCTRHVASHNRII